MIIVLDEYGYPPVTIDDVYKEVLEQAENFKKYANDTVEFRAATSLDYYSIEQGYGLLEAAEAPVNES